jgi:hypothetical protein
MDDNAKGCLALVLGIVAIIFLGRALVGVYDEPEEGNACTRPGEKVVAEDGTELVCR